MSDAAMTQTMRKKGNLGLEENEKRAQGRESRKMILAAARKVFSRHSFRAASIRMIAQEGRFPHGNIRSHFPNKAALFEEVVKDLCEDYYRQDTSWLAEVAGLPLEQSLSVYMDRLLAYNRETPEALQILNLNLSQAGTTESVPGYGHILGLLKRTRKTFEKNIPDYVPRDQVYQFTDAFNGLVFHFIGAGKNQALVLGMDPSSPRYYAWVKSTMLAVFVPMLKAILFPEKSKEKK